MRRQCASKILNSPILRGDIRIVKEHLGNSVTSLAFDRGSLLVSALSPQHFRMQTERSVGTIIRLVENLTTQAPDRLQEFRQEFDALVDRFFLDNRVRQDYLLSRAVKLLA